METGGSSALAVGVKKTTPKAIINQKFGRNACYKVEEVQESNQNECPGLAIQQKGPCLYRCTLQLPELSVVSETFKKKKDAEQSAAEMALEKLGMHPETSNPVIQDPWDELTSRISYLFSDEFYQKYLFSDEFVSSLHPLSGHFRATLHRAGDSDGLIPVSVLPVCDAKLSNLCKSINPEVESNPCFSMSIIVKAASRLSGIVSVSERQLWMRRQNPYPYSLEVLQSFNNQQSNAPESIWAESIRVPCALDETVEQLTLNVSSCGYYLDAIAQKLGVPDASNVLISRTVGKASTETRLYFVAPDSYLLSDNGREAVDGKGSFNARASYLCGQNVYGDAIMASIGYKWNSKDLFYEDLSLRSYFRMLLNKIPSGVYKLSREAILTAELPAVYTTRGNWRGSFPKELLCMFCRQHRLSEPVFSIASIPLKAPSEFSKLPKDSGTEADHANGGDVAAATDGEPTGLGDSFRCEVKISKCQELLVQCSPKNSYKKQIDATQNASLNVLLWLNAYFQELDMPLEKLTSFADVLDIQFHPQKFIKEFELCLPIHDVRQRSETQVGRVLDSNCRIQPFLEQGQEFRSLDIEGPDSGVSPSNGSVVCLSYAVSLVKEGEHMKEQLENCPDFEFEIGTGAVIPHLETVVTQMHVDQTAFFSMDLPHQDLVLAAAGATAKTLAFLSSKACCLEYSLTLLRVTEPLEDRMEQAFFSPPLSKQRVEFALQHIKKSHATTLIDFGCGSGSLLDSLLDYPTALENIVGVDISQKSLTRAAKTLHSKLSKDSDAAVPSTCVKSAQLYEGSITAFDSRVCGFDIGTCLEVIEHMEEDQARLFGDMALGYFCPGILVVSTPNYEYNVILQKSNLPNQEEDPDEKSHSQACKFRNHDHKFEWTRGQFNHWASDLAARHNYSVEFSGVGGSAGLEPGFASQIAVFRRGVQPLGGDNYPQNVESCQQYQVIWEWNSTRSKVSL